jgi:hypothetical protein
MILWHYFLRNTSSNNEHKLTTFNQGFVVNNIIDDLLPNIAYTNVGILFSFSIANLTNNYFAQ